ncbi:MAG: type II toxin-antitoxin system RelE/ParE family toxin [Alcaligenaceae bacterium]|jgi:phage-related protein
MWTVQVNPLAEAELVLMPADIRARFVHIAEMLEQFGPQQVGMPHVRFLQDKLWEMRLTGRDGIARAISITQTDKQILVLHVFIKKTQKTPRGAIQTATNRLERINNEKP